MSYRERNGAKLSIIIPVAGISRRLKSHNPKCLIDLGNGESIIQRQIRLLRKQFPKAEIIVVVGYQSEKVLKNISKIKGLKVVENDLYEQTSIVRSIDLALKVASHSTIMVVYGDLVFNQQTFTTIYKWETSVIVDKVGQIHKDEVGVTINGNTCSYFSYGLETKWAMILLLAGKELDVFKINVADKSNRKLQTFEILNTLLDHGGRIKVIEPTLMKITEVDTFGDIEKARNLVKQ